MFLRVIGFASAALSTVALVTACSGSATNPPVSQSVPTVAAAAAPATPGAATIAPTTARRTTAPVTPVPAPTHVAASAAEATAPTEAPLAPEQNPVGDIPDTQAFVSYQASAGGYTLDVPEGWARTTTGTDVRFISKFNGVSVAITPAQAAPTAATARDTVLAALATQGRAVTIGDVSDVTLPAGSAVRAVVTENSAPDPVTNKHLRIEENVYLLYHNGSLATMTLWAPQGADNVDQWKRMSESFRWN